MIAIARSREPHLEVSKSGLLQELLEFAPRPLPNVRRIRARSAVISTVCELALGRGDHHGLDARLDVPHLVEQSLGMSQVLDDVRADDQAPPEILGGERQGIRRIEVVLEKPGERVALLANSDVVADVHTEDLELGPIANQLA